jgi:hypothetical protein
MSFQHVAKYFFVALKDQFVVHWGPSAPQLFFGLCRLPFTFNRLQGLSSAECFNPGYRGASEEKALRNYLTAN